MKLSDDAVRRLDEATRALKEAMGGNCDPWQGGADSRIR
jgi:hypothetical protein